jgi:RimJ/RimL family protein N-acetyltransferase
MSRDPNVLETSSWRAELPALSGRLVMLREPAASDLGSLVELLSLADATHFGLEEDVTGFAVEHLIDRSLRERIAGMSITYAITIASGRMLAGLLQLRQLDPTFEAAEWECTIGPSWRGTGVFLEAARLAGSFAFDTLGSHRLEARVPMQNGRANGALRKLGAVQEGILRRSIRRGGDYIDQALWSVLKEDWGERRMATTPRFH